MRKAGCRRGFAIRKCVRSHLIGGVGLANGLMNTAVLVSTDASWVDSYSFRSDFKLSIEATMALLDHLHALKGFKARYHSHGICTNQLMYY